MMELRLTAYKMHDAPYPGSPLGAYEIPTGGSYPFPREIVKVRSVNEALAALEEYAGRAALTGRALVVVAQKHSGRSPKGFNSLTQRELGRVLNADKLEK